MRKFQYLLITLVVLSLLTGCTTFQAKEAGRAVAGLPGELLGRALEDAVDGHRLRPAWYARPAAFQHGSLVTYPRRSGADGVVIVHVGQLVVGNGFDFAVEQRIDVV